MLGLHALTRSCCCVPVMCVLLLRSPMAPTRRQISADSALMCIDKKVIALKAVTPGTGNADASCLLLLLLLLLLLREQGAGAFEGAFHEGVKRCELTVSCTRQRRSVCAFNSRCVCKRPPLLLCCARLE